jgi:hypothetical protein
MFHVVGVAVGYRAAWETAVAVAVLERPPHRRRNHPRFAADVEHTALSIVHHLHGRGVAGDAPGRFRGDALAVREDALPLPAG